MRPEEQPSDDPVGEAIARCIKVLRNSAALRDATHELRLSSDPRAVFAAALFDLERAKRGEEDARQDMALIADTLLTFFRDGSGTELSATHIVLTKLWSEAARMVLAFEQRQTERALNACWAARDDKDALAAAIEQLQPEGQRHVEFARCLYHLELARLGVASSRAEFAMRAGLLSECYQSEDVAKVLIGEDEGLKHLWKDLLPYLDEFFELLEEQAERKAKAAAKKDKDEAKTDPFREPVGRIDDSTLPGRPPTANLPPLPVPTVPEPRPLPPDAPPPPVPEPPPDLPPDQWLALGAVSRPSAIISEDELVAAEPTVVKERPAPPSAPPRPPGDMTPPGAWIPPPKPGEDVEEVEILEIEATPATAVPPPPPKRRSTNLDVVLTDGYEPDAATQKFWSHTFASLDLLPDPKVQRTAKRLLSADSRAERKRLNEYLESLPTHGQVPEANAFGCMVRLLMAGQLKEKSLFGQKNTRRLEAFAQAFALLGGTPQAAGHSAVWFILDGAETDAALQRGLEVLSDFLAYCLRERRDPLDPQAHKDFLGLS